MKRQLARLLSLVMVLGLLASLLAACGSAPDLKENYPLESVNKEGHSTSYVYRASGQSVEEVADELASQKKPDQISSANSEHMFLVYGKQWYHLQQDPKKPEDTLVEVDSEEYVRSNYNSSFLETYLAARLIGDLFGSGGGYGSYRGYGSKDEYKPKQGTYHKPTEQDKKIAPPVTVERKGQITRRGSSKSVTDPGSVGGGSSKSDSGTSKGSITRKKSGSDFFNAPKPKISKPKTRFGTGKIGRRGR
ncbi:DUF4247 domain-containing protein [Paenibacillus sp. GCM10012306]|uniref:DUF4247 domain-containing protein n=1 Tax=Paenibacillus sp. GCM10012306 TaxID=3317342 RepID=UPI003611EABD